MGVAKISIGKVSVYGVQSAASVSFGSGSSYFRRSHSKSNQGSGTIIGDRSAMPSWVAWIEDQDIFDTPAWYWSDRPSV